MVCSVVGCGPTAKDWFNTPHDLSIGVNDCGKWGKDPDWLIVVNRKFSPEREAIIRATKAKRFLTQIPYWQKTIPGAEHIRLSRFTKHVKKGHVYCSKTSPFIALSMAFNAGAKDIILFGVDLNNHAQVKGKLKDYELRNFEKLCRGIAEQGTRVWVSSTESSLSKFLPVWKINQ